VNVVVTGASSAIGRFLLPKLLSAGHDVIAISRRPRAGNDGVIWLEADLSEGEWPDAGSPAVLIHLAPIWLLKGFLETALAAGLERVIAISSTSLFTKTGSVTAQERAITRLLASGEDCLRASCEQNNVPWVLFRPTLIYGAGLDKNISSIARIVESWGVFIMPGIGGGLRQPVHAEDIASACLAALQGGDNRAFNLSGGSTIPYTAMVEQIFKVLEKPERIIHLPAWLVKGMVPAIRLLPRFRHLTQGMLQRIETDLCFDHGEAAEALDYAPRAFLQNGRSDLGL